MSDIIKEQECNVRGCHQKATTGVRAESPTHSDCWLMYALCDHHLELWKKAPKPMCPLCDSVGRVHFLDYEIVALEDLSP